MWVSSHSDEGKYTQVHVRNSSSDQRAGNVYWEKLPRAVAAGGSLNPECWAWIHTERRSRKLQSYNSELTLRLLANLED